MLLTTTRLSKFLTKLSWIARSPRRWRLQTVPGIFSGIRVFGMEISKPVPFFLRFGRYLARLRHKDQNPTCRKCNRPCHQARTCPNMFCFNCEEPGHMTDFCPAWRNSLLYLPCYWPRGSWLFEFMESAFFSFTIWHLWHASATTFLVVSNFCSIFSAIHCAFSCNIFRTVFAVFWSVNATFPAGS